MDTYDGLLTGVLASFSVPYNPFSTQQLQHIPPLKTIQIKCNAARAALHGPGPASLPPSTAPPYCSAFLFIPGTQQAHFQLHILLEYSVPGSWGLHWLQNQTHPT